MLGNWLEYLAVFLDSGLNMLRNLQFVVDVLGDSLRLLKGVYEVVRLKDL